MPPVWIAHAVPLLVTRHRVRTLCPVCRLRAPDGVGPVSVSGDVSSAASVGASAERDGALRAPRVLDVASWLEDSFATPCVPGEGCDACDGRAHAGALDLTALVALDPQTRDALRDGKIDRALARVDRTPALAVRLAELVARGEVAAPEAERHVGPSY